MNEPKIKFTYLTGIVPFIEPKYSIEPRLDLRVRFKDWVIICDTGISLAGFETREAAFKAALQAGMRIG